MKSIFTITRTLVARKRKIFALFFFLIPYVGLSRAATSGSCGKNLTWEFNTETNTLIITGTGAMADYTSSHTTDNPQTAPWWSDWSYYRITSISLPECLTHIGEYAFWQCVKVQSVTLPSTLKTIGENGFCYMGARTITLPEGVTSIGMEAFELCEWLTSVTLPASLTYIGHRAFGRCVKLKSVYN
ncbi:MAG: leucine-rich repeat domain-containing protein, partial [Paludibacteraceae bacterium]|nr:leucine-rich repeat domain-containing protein [Paludibacteraceae bacterium]